MSIWSNIRGEVKVHPDKHFSIRKYTENMYEECIIKVKGTYVEMCVCLDGKGMNDFIEKWISGIPGEVDLIVETRWIK